VKSRLRPVLVAATLVALLAAPCAHAAAPPAPGAANTRSYELHFRKGHQHVLLMVETGGSPLVALPDAWNARVVAADLVRVSRGRASVHDGSHRYLLDFARSSPIALVDADGPLPIVLEAYSLVPLSGRAAASTRRLLIAITRSFHARWSGPPLHESLEAAASALVQRANAGAASRDAYTETFNASSDGISRIQAITSQGYRAEYDQSGRLVFVVIGPNEYRFDTTTGACDSHLTWRSSLWRPVPSDLLVATSGAGLTYSAPRTEPDGSLSFRVTYWDRQSGLRVVQVMTVDRSTGLLESRGDTEGFQATFDATTPIVPQPAPAHCTQEHAL
jgi:hypothetical protein